MTSPWEHAGPPPPAGTEGRPTALALTYLVVVGPAVWMLHLAGGAALVPAACGGRWAWWAINALTVVCALVIGHAAWWSFRILVRHRPDGPSPDTTIAVVAGVAVLWNLISLLVTVLEGVPNLVLDACPR